MLDAAQDKQTSAPASTLEIAVRGMTCAACVRRVEKAIGAVDGVVDASVNLATERAHVSVAAGTSGESVADAIRRAGYEPVLSTIDLRIDGMTCASCVGRVEKALRSVPGVLEANVNLATERATVRIIGGEAIVPDLLAAVKQVGYGADVVGGGAGEAERDRLRRADDLALLRRSFLTAAIATAPLVVLEMGTHLSPGLHHLLATTIGQPVMQLISVLCATIVQFGPGREFYSRGFPALRRRSSGRG